MLFFFDKEVCVVLVLLEELVAFILIQVGSDVLTILQKLRKHDHLLSYYLPFLADFLNILNAEGLQHVCELHLPTPQAIRSKVA